MWTLQQRIPLLLLFWIIVVMTYRLPPQQQPRTTTTTTITLITTVHWFCEGVTIIIDDDDDIETNIIDTTTRISTSSSTIVDETCTTTTLPSSIDGDTQECVIPTITTTTTTSILTETTTTTTKPVSTKEEDEKEKEELLLECHLYMGPSTIPNAGLGIFTGRPYYYSDSDHTEEDTNHNNNNMYIGLGDICIPLIDMYTHINFYHHHFHLNQSHHSMDANDKNATTTTSSSSSSFRPLFPNPYDLNPHRHWVHNPLRDYFWNGYSAMGMIHGESSTMDMEAYCPGLDCAINCHLGLVNVDSSVPIYNDYHSMTTSTSTTSNKNNNNNNNNDAPPHRQVHPGTGAYSPYHIRPPSGTSKRIKKKKKTNILRNIPIGGELFKHYGESWFTTRPEIFGNIPLTNDYIWGEVILQKFLSLHIVHPHTLLSTNDDPDDDDDDDRVVEDLYNNVLIPIQRIYDTRTLNALPQLYAEIRQVLPNNDNNKNDGMITRILQRKHQRTISELQQTSACLDHIRPDTSTIPYAGDGAFATRNLPNSTIITISPLHHIPNYYNFMNMYKIQQLNNNNNKMNLKKHSHGGTIPPDDDDDEVDNDEPYYRILDDIQNHQLLMNYCYGHANSTVLLCPYGSGINYFNHHSTLYNVQLQWIPHTSTSLLQTFNHNVTAVEHGTVDDLFRTERSQLAMQYVTIRDIQKGEELFINYGIEWEMAWNNHVQQFFDTNGSQNPRSSYISAAYFNTMFGMLPLPTVQEQIQQTAGTVPNVDNIRLIPDNLQVRCHRALLFQTIGNIHFHYVWSDDNHGVPCRIIDRFEPHFNPTSPMSNNSSDNDRSASTKEFLYTIQLEWDDGKDANSGGGGGVNYAESSMTWILRTDVPRSAIKLYDVPYTSDIHQRRTFRHPIYLSNDLFPKQWRNLE